MGEQQEKPDLTPSELAELREAIKDRDRRRWLVDVIKRWAQWLSAVALGGTVLWDWASRIISHIKGP